MDLTPTQLAALDQAHAESEAELDQRIAELGAAIDGLPTHTATALLINEYARMPLDTARAILPVFMYRLIRLTNTLGREQTKHARDMFEAGHAAGDSIRVLHERIAGLEGTLATVRDKHHARTEHRNSGCVECGLIWPCNTYLAVKDAAGDTTKENTHP